MSILGNVGNMGTVVPGVQASQAGSFKATMRYPTQSTLLNIDTYIF